MLFAGAQAKPYLPRAPQRLTLTANGHGVINKPASTWVF